MKEEHVLDLIDEILDEIDLGKTKRTKCKGALRIYARNNLMKPRNLVVNRKNHLMYNPKDRAKISNIMRYRLEYLVDGYKTKLKKAVKRINMPAWDPKERQIQRLEILAYKTSSEYKEKPRTIIQGIKYLRVKYKIQIGKEEFTEIMGNNASYKKIDMAVIDEKLN